jgi:uncharacterized protein (DUF1778 family)
VHAFVDKTAEISERSSERMSFRAKPHVKQAIQRAAALSGVDDSVFTMNAAYRAAVETIATHERTTLSPADYEAFFEALDNPPPPTDALRAAAKRYHERYSNR